MALVFLGWNPRLGKRRGESAGVYHGGEGRLKNYRRCVWPISLLGHWLMVSTKINIQAAQLQTERTDNPSDKMTVCSLAMLDCQMSEIVAADKVVAWRRKSEKRQLRRLPNR
jgi:hypothetical protein